MLWRVAVVSSLLTLAVIVFPRTTLAAVGDALLTITPIAVSPFVSPILGTQDGTSPAIVQGPKLAGVDSVLVPGSPSTIDDGNATPLLRPSGLPTNCSALAWIPRRS